MKNHYSLIKFYVFLCLLFTIPSLKSQWIYQDNPYFNSMYGFTSVHFVDKNNGWAVGDWGRIVKYDGTEWIEQNSNTYGYLNSVFFLNKNNGWAVGRNVSGKNSPLLRFKDNKWIPLESNTRFDLGSVFFTDSLNGFMVGGSVDTTNYNLFLQYHENKWIKYKWFSPYGIYSLYFTDSNHGWAVGGGDQFIINQANVRFIHHYLILKYNGKIWDVQDSGIGYSHLWSVCLPDTNHGWAVGDSGTILKFNGKHWFPEKCPTKNDLSSVYFLDSLHGWAVGSYGIILKFDGKNWIKQDSGKAWCLNSVFFTDLNNGWAVGSEGTILYTSNGGEIVSTNDLSTNNYQLTTNIFPNPVNNQSSILYYLPEKSVLSLKIYDFTSREISILINETQDKGNHKIPLNTQNLKDGIYFYKLTAGGKSITKKIIVLKD